MFFNSSGSVELKPRNDLNLGLKWEELLKTMDWDFAELWPVDKTIHKLFDYVLGVGRAQ